MNLKEWAAREGVSYTTARRWLAAGKLPVPAQKVGGLILVEDKAVPAPGGNHRRVRPRVVGGPEARP